MLDQNNLFVELILQRVVHTIGRRNGKFENNHSRSRSTPVIYFRQPKVLSSWPCTRVQSFLRRKARCVKLHVTAGAATGKMGSSIWSRALYRTSPHGVNYPQVGHHVAICGALLLGKTGPLKHKSNASLVKIFGFAQHCGTIGVLSRLNCRT